MFAWPAIYDICSPKQNCTPDRRPCHLEATCSLLPSCFAVKCYYAKGLLLVVILLITFSERKAMVLGFGYVLSIEHSAFSTLRFFNTPHFQHSRFSTLRDSRRAFFNVSIYLLSNLAQGGFPKVLKVFNFIVSTFVEFYAIETWRFVNEW